MPEAARVDDQVQHSDAFPGLLTGLVVGALIGVAIVGTGGAALVVLAAAATGASIGATALELVGSLMTDPAGPIRTGVNSVIIGPEHRIAATVFSYVDCNQHDSNVQVAEGSATVWIGAAGQYAARVGDQGTCGFKIAEGCATVIIGGPTATGAGLSVGNEVPLWAQGLVLVLGLAGGGLGMAIKGLSMGVIAARLGAGFVFGMGGSMGASWVGGKLFGENSFGQRVFALGGGFLGAMLGDGMVTRGSGILSGLRNADEGTGTVGGTPEDINGNSNSGQRMLPAPEPPLKPTAQEQVDALDGHGHDRHGAQTTLAEQETRLKTGIAPDGVLAKTSRATKFDSPEAELDAVQRAQARTAARVANGDVSTSIPVGSNGPVLPRDASVVTGFPGGYGSGLEVPINPATGNPYPLPSRGGLTMNPTGQDANALVVLQYEPATGTWQPVTQYPTNQPVSP